MVMCDISQSTLFLTVHSHGSARFPWSICVRTLNTVCSPVWLDAHAVPATLGATREKCYRPLLAVFSQWLAGFVVAPLERLNPRFMAVQDFRFSFSLGEAGNADSGLFYRGFRFSFSLGEAETHDFPKELTAFSQKSKFSWKTPWLQESNKRF